MSDIMAPVVLFVYNRPEHTKKTLEALDCAIGANETKLYIYSDAPKNNKAMTAVMEVRRIIDEYRLKSSFKCVDVRKAENNLGLATNIINGVTEIIYEFGKVIVLEDDLEVSQDFLTYMNGALDFYKDKASIWAISGYTFPMKALEDYKYDVYLSGRGCSWGWATWKDRWDTVDWEVSDYSKFKWNIGQRRKFAKWGADLPTMMDAYIYGEIHSWAIRWCYSAFRQGKQTVYPVVSRIKNHGTDGTGTNFGKIETKYDTELSKNVKNCNFTIPPENKNIQKEFSNKYVTGIDRVKVELRWFLIRIGIMKAK